jgi:hypothetical protein
MGRTQPTREREFIAWALNLDARCTEQQQQWNLNPASVQTLNELTHIADTAYQHNCNPETCNRRSRAGKKTSIAALRAFLRFFVYALLSNEAVSENDLKAMGLPSRKRHARQPLPVPADAPAVSVEATQGHEVRVFVRVPQHNHPTESLTRKAYHGFAVRYRKDDEAEWHEEHSTRLHTILVFNSEDTGKHLTLAAAWINPRLQRGPWSNEIHAWIN